MTKKICVVIGSRANYSSAKSICRAIKTHDDLELKVIVGASALLDRYGNVEDQIATDGFQTDARVFMLVEGETPLTMAKSTGLGLIELSTTLDNMKPDAVVTIGDRFETMSTALAASYLNIPLVHTMGGEVSGNIDETVRHAITKLSHLHFPASNDAAERIRRMGEEEHRIHMVGCPRIDLVAEILEGPEPEGLKEICRKDGVGRHVDPDKPFILVSQHPVTYEYEDGEQQIKTTLDAVAEIGLPTIVLWPNADAGSENVSRGIRKYRENNGELNMHFFKNLSIDHYTWLMRKTVCQVGNSSSAIREGAFIGTPSVNIGNRQVNRERGSNVIDAENNRESIVKAIQNRMNEYTPKMEPVYGTGRAAKQIADILARTDIQIEKRMTY